MSQRAADISEEMHFVEDDSLMNKNSYGGSRVFKQQLDSETSLDLQAGYRDHHSISTNNELVKSNESWSDRFFSFQLTFVAYLLFTSSFTFIGILSAPMLNDLDKE